MLKAAGVSRCRFNVEKACETTLPAIFLYHMKGQSLEFSATQQWTVVGGQRSLPPKMGDRGDPHPFKNCSR